MSPIPPKLPVGRKTLPSIQDDVVAPGAVHSLRPAAPPFDERNTVPPPAMPMSPPRNLRGSQTGVKLPTKLPTVQSVDDGWEREPTIIGSPAPPTIPPEDEERTTGEVTEDGLFSRYETKAREASTAKASAAAERARAEAAEKEAADLRDKLLKAASEPHEPEPHTDRRAWLKVAYGFSLGLVGLIGAATAWLETHTSKVETHVDKVAEKQRQQETETDPLPARIAKLEAYIRADAARRACLDSQVRSAVSRGTGHVITNLSDSTPVHWGSEVIPRARPSLIWSPVWFTTSDCPSSPVLP